VTIVIIIVIGIAVACIFDRWKYNLRKRVRGRGFWRRVNMVLVGLEGEIGILDGHIY
jgi:hypothetical protein